jgi:mannose-6-phosphate isomerase-like protein (cupin superfamily)
MALIKADTLRNGNLEGGAYGASVSVILDESGVGQGPRLHRHPYDETWVLVEGEVTFRAGETSFTALAGDMVVVPAHVPHAFTNTGDTRAKLVCIHASPSFVTEWLE